MISVSHSEAESFTTCERRHFYSYGLKIDAPPEAASLDALRGTYVHLGMAIYCLVLRDDPKANPLHEALKVILQQENKAIAGEAAVILQNFHKYYAAEISTWRILEVEMESELVLVKDKIKTIIFPDLVAWIPGQGITVVDWKVVYDFMQQKYIDLAGQPVKYMVGRQVAGVNVQSAMFFQLRHRKLKTPTKETTFRASYLTLSAARTFNTLKEQTIVASRISALKALPLSEWERKIVRNANKTVCNYCPFTDICREDLHGNDTSLMQRAYYVPRTRREKTPIPNDEL